MSSFNALVKRVQILGEAKTSPYAASHSSFGGVTKQMRAGGLSSAPLDTIKFIREILFNLDVITNEELETVKSAKGFTGKKQAMLAVLRANQDGINAKADDITQAVESSLDNFISGMGANRSREEKYAAQAAATEIAAEMRKARSGKELDDSLVDIVSDEKLLVKASLAKAIQELEDLPDGEDLAPEILKNIKEFAPKIDNVEQFESFVKQMGAMEEYQIPAFHLSGTIKALKGGLEDIGMEDQEDPDDLQAKIDAALAEGGIDEKDARDIERLNRDGEEEEGKYDDHDGEDERCDYVPCEDGEGSVKQEVLADVTAEAGEFSHKAAGMADAAQKMYNIYGKRGDQEKAEIAANLAHHFSGQSKFEDEEELTLESVYDTMGFIKAPVMNENGTTSSTCSTQQYLTEATEQIIEESEKYTADYLTEQKEADSYTSAPKEKSVSFKERFKPKTQSQLEELRRYGL
jgi:hypothetical protein|tara:strand:+ start:26 stop:1414 length:1389 start_codon:yes stop_codon:yes gene_type:complete